METKPLLIVIEGPTGVGKTDVAISVAERLGTEIVNADSRQIYRDIPIGTAAPTAEQQARVRHHFVGTLALSDYYSAARFEREALASLACLFKERGVAVMCGGSMMYIDAVCQGIDCMPDVDADVRRSLRSRLESEGVEPLLEELRVADPAYYAEVDRRNGVRVVHALEVFYTSGRPFSAFRSGQKKERPFRILKIGLNLPREVLFDRINRRVSKMVEAGLLDEVERVMPQRKENALNTVGYKELFRWKAGEWALDFALERMRKNTRVYAKKQITWLKKDTEINWFEPSRTDDLFALIDGAVH